MPIGELKATVDDTKALIRQMAAGRRAAGK